MAEKKDCPVCSESGEAIVILKKIDRNQDSHYEILKRIDERTEGHTETLKSLAKAQLSVISDIATNTRGMSQAQSSQAAETKRLNDYLIEERTDKKDLLSDLRGKKQVPMSVYLITIIFIVLIALVVVVAATHVQLVVDTSSIKIVDGVSGATIVPTIQVDEKK